ncbi:erythrocyte membrane antigen 1 [Plasmodium chabaudi adami]|uniref:Erythrocyte membrane antigen 1 n=1 Tax=Plasmodium chabaudi adami TaxID=5826 RepID=A0A1D3L6U4_PLACE|nr:erythrocyte membrane antigen 1 [Plasmodium chabaudi adami]SCL82997.1 erythrocyte membrane antigen 1 [Plasmodium chabaudi adami]
MKIISLGLISSIIFSIVLARNSSNSKSTTGWFPLCRKKTKKNHKTTAEPVKVHEKVDFDPKLPNLKFIDEFDPIILEVYKGRLSELVEPYISETDGTVIDKVTGFLIRENDSSLSGWYIRPYEEDYEDMIKVNYIPLREYYHRKQKNAHKQSGTPPPVYKMSEKQELSTIHEKGSNILHEDKEELDKENENKSEDEDELEAELMALLFPKDREHDKEFKEQIRRLYHAWKKAKEERGGTEVKKMDKMKMKMKTKPKNKIKCWN